MISINEPYASFPFEWTVKSTVYKIKYRKAFDLTEIDEVICLIISSKRNVISISEVGRILGFNLVDLAETEILFSYLNCLCEYNLIKVSTDSIRLTETGQDALQSKHKYKYFYGTTELFEDHTTTADNFHFSYRDVFNLENALSLEINRAIQGVENVEVQKKLQFQVFENDIYKGEIVESIKSKSDIRYRNIALQCVVETVENSFQVSFFKLGVRKLELNTLFDLPENDLLKQKLIRIGKYHNILAEKNSISKQDIVAYSDLWNWNELAAISKVEWNDTGIFDLFRQNGDGTIWSTMSQKVPIDAIKAVIEQYADYWSWSILTQRFDSSFIQRHIGAYKWDFEQLSYREPELVISSLLIPKLKDCDWDWNYLSKTLPDEFIEKTIDDFAWDFYEITISKTVVFKNIFIKHRDRLGNLISKSWNWRFISLEINLQFLQKNILDLASKVDWHIVLMRFFTNEEITSKLLIDESFKLILGKYLPENFTITHENYLWTSSLIGFLDQENLIQWPSISHIKGFDTNDSVTWHKDIFLRFHDRIITNEGKRNVSQNITEFILIEEFPGFLWDWEGISKNKMLLCNPIFIERALSGDLPYSNNLNWNEILLLSSYDICFWNRHLDAFFKTTAVEKHVAFWSSLTYIENIDYVLENSNFPWDWQLITSNCSSKSILKSVNDEELLEKWDWQIATPKLGKDNLLANLEKLTRFIEWNWFVNEIFSNAETNLLLRKQVTRIAGCLSVLEIDKRKQIWKYLTACFPFDVLYDLIESTFLIADFEWDWDFVSDHMQFPTDIGTLSKYKDQISWKILSNSVNIKDKFNPWKWNNIEEWFNNTDKYLAKFVTYWDWHALSSNRNLTYDRVLLTKYIREEWDWEKLSEFGGFLRKQQYDTHSYLSIVVAQFPQIKFDFLSKRNDIDIDTDLILSNSDENWDWNILSANGKVEISNVLLLTLEHKPWNWVNISKRKNIAINNETLLKLIDKEWDWVSMSKDIGLRFDAQFIEKVKFKSWDWKLISHHTSFLPTVEILKLVSQFGIDWEYISQKKNLNPLTVLLARYVDKWEWKSITKHPRINFKDIDFIERFADKWDWSYICKSGKLTLSSRILTQFKDYLKWDLISANTSIDFTREIIQEFKQYWNWAVLKENKRIEELLGDYISVEIGKSSTLSFIYKIEKQPSAWKGYIYHFSHIDNAVEIIQSKKIQSRNNANIKGDAAGNVVHIRNVAHDYARFYFRPHTPTQFYNEFLGKSSTDGYENKQDGWFSWYDKARALGFPKCPVPIFFRFSIKEVLFKQAENCCISNGNMQTGSTIFGSIDTMVNKFGYDNLFYTPENYATTEDYNRYRTFAQQEFLVKDELSFKDLIDFEIICSSDTDKALLVRLLGKGSEDIFSKILVNENLYNNENPRIQIEESNNELHISTPFDGEGYFLLSAVDTRKIDILSGDVIKIDIDKVVFKSFISIGNIAERVQLYFIDESNRRWFVYSNQLVQNVANPLTVWIKNNN